MDGFFLLLGHMVGDYVVQNDWMAANKTAWRDPAKDGPTWRQKVTNTGHLACTAHCLCYTLAVWACSFWWMPWWGLVACFVVHWPVDRFRLAGRWMRNVAGQTAFASGPLAPWSVIVVDNTFHMITLGLIALPYHLSSR